MMIKKFGIVVITLFASVSAINAQNTIKASKLKPGDDKIAALPSVKKSVNVQKPDFAKELDDEFESEQLVKDMLADAKSFMGLKYIWGGTTTKGFDCSGFTGYLYKQYGVKLKRCARDQYTQGLKVERDEVQPGDLVFFGNRQNAAGVIGHVGMVYSVDKESGEIYFIHSSCKKGVTVTKLSENYYNTRFKGARRIFGYVQ